ncbi:hypothetical protein MKW92_034213 [Papaver armeniacum]|nr:hypothetical protein MKW92_034213 [Papaver armeniacum]
MAESENTNTIHGTPTTNGSLATSEDYITRFLAIAFTFAAVIIMAVGNETKIGPNNVEAHAKWQYMSAFKLKQKVYCFITIFCFVYSALSLILVIGNRCDFAVIHVDLIILSLLCYANGAAASVFVIGDNVYGDSGKQWKKVCNLFESYCNHTAISIMSSLSAALLFIFLLARAAQRLHRKRL